jgi:hypothetical protein
VLHAQREGMVPPVACAVVVSSVPLGKVSFSRFLWRQFFNAELSTSSTVASRVLCANGWCVNPHFGIFARLLQVKVVTLRGHSISKSGAMTGGSSTAERVDRWEEREVDGLRQRKAELEGTL